jgi:hypothetical protein
MVGYEFLLLRVLIVILSGHILFRVTSPDKKRVILILLMSLFVSALICYDATIYVEVSRDGGIFISIVNFISYWVAAFIMFAMYFILKDEGINNGEESVGINSCVIMKGLGAYSIVITAGLSMLAMLLLTAAKVLMYVWFAVGFSVLFFISLFPLP